MRRCLHKSESGVSISKFSVHLYLPVRQKSQTKKVFIDGKTLEFTVKDSRQMVFLLRRARLACNYNSDGIFALQARGLVSKKTVVLRQWGRETQNFD